MKKDNIIKTIYYYEKARTACFNVGQYLHKENIVLLSSECDSNGLKSVEYYHKDHDYSNYYYKLERVNMGFKESIHEGLQDLIS